jgi:hypothetical protein
MKGADSATVTFGSVPTHRKSIDLFRCDSFIFFFRFSLCRLRGFGAIVQERPFRMLWTVWKRVKVQFRVNQNLATTHRFDLNLYISLHFTEK